ncbi:DUF2956 domain-containing protein [Motilimonas sp. E26]|uniref:DUF2956 domain-containing protein n=1 Tax=Motilimonas sp. E26 TaxID=2865674 RepID=UPI001E5C3F75|nr:DUF2956 domain-containing protein [Motilimonas sp. E26]MCE0555591.1 DUF2956 domain-containing protein [Motilimonas sp. E26]
MSLIIINQEVVVFLFSPSIVFPYLKHEEQTKLIAQGIQKGIEEYKKRNKEKARELDKQKRKLQQAKSTLEQEQTNPTISNETLPTQPTTAKQSVLPWLLLAISWLGFAGYFFLLHP